MALNQYVPVSFGSGFCSNKTNERKNRYSQSFKSLLKKMHLSKLGNWLVYTTKMNEIFIDFVCIKWQMVTLQQIDQIIDFVKWMWNCDNFFFAFSTFLCLCLNKSISIYLTMWLCDIHLWWKFYEKLMYPAAICEIASNNEHFNR